MEKYLESNKKRWNELADIHFKSQFYNVNEFIKNGISISDLEIKEVGEVTGKKLLHLQCHFGKDTISWARLGAQVTGVDFSDRAIELAKQLSQKIGIHASFICSEISELDKTILDPKSFDIVYTSHGAIYWLPDLERWAQIIMFFLKPNGVFYIADSHPTACIFDDECENDLIVRFPYFHQIEPLEFDYDGSYANGEAKLKNIKEYGWVHNLSYIVNSLINVGLQIEFIHEFPFTSWKMFPFLEERENGWWHLPAQFQKIPLMFTLKARKE